MNYSEENPFLVSSPRFFTQLLGLDTPAIAYDFTRLRATALALKRWCESMDAVCCYAVKANRNGAILNELASFGFGADIASKEELLSASAADMSPINATNPGLDAITMREVHRHGGIIYFDRDQQLQHAESLGIPVREHGVRLSMPGDYGHFGFSLPELACVENIPHHFHFHSGDIQNLPNLVEKLRCISAILRKYPAKSVNMGGGFGILSNSVSDFEAAGHMLAEFSRVARVQLVFEFGKVAVARCGALVTSVVGAKDRSGVQTVFVDATTTVLGSWEQWKVSRVGLGEGPLRPSAVFGSSCYEGDFFAKRCLLPRLKVGDRLVMRNVGAYFVSVGGSLHGREVPQEFRLE